MLETRRLCAQTGNYSFDPLPDMPADFGPRIPPEGVEGLLVVRERLQRADSSQASVFLPLAWTWDPGEVASWFLYILQGL